MLALISLTLAFIASPALAASGVTTWNDYTTQSGVACSGYSATNSPKSGVYSAAISDLSPIWSGAKCSGSQDSSKCNGSGSCTNCTGPSCPQTNCGVCYNIKCTGTLDGETSGACTGNTIKVMIIDACPSTHPANYCKIPAFGGTVPPNQACEASGVNAFDIASTAKSALSSYQYNLNIDVEGPVSC